MNDESFIVKNSKTLFFNNFSESMSLRKIIK